MRFRFARSTNWFWLFLATLAGFFWEPTGGVPRLAAQAGRQGFVDPQDRSSIESEKSRLHAAGRTSELRLLLNRLVAANPQDAQSRMELLDLEPRLEAAKAIQGLEALLDSDAQPAFPTGRSDRNRTRFTSYFDLAYRLMRLYERDGQTETMHQLGLRVARGDKPFEDPERSSYGPDVPASANACLAVAIQYADSKAEQTALADALKNSSWIAAKAQIARRLSGGWKVPPLQGAAKADFGWANVPAGVRLLASNENVLALASDDRHVYAGHPWGVAVYDLQGNAMTRVALGEPARTLAVMARNVWVGTPKGLFRIARDDWTVVHQWLHDDLPAWQRHETGSLRELNNGVSALAPDGESLWIGLRRNVQVLNTRTLELRAYSNEELQLDNRGDFAQILHDGSYVWAYGHSAGLRRYDRAADRWAATATADPRYQLRFIGIIDDNVYASVYLDDTRGYRPCRIDRETLAATPMLFETERGVPLHTRPLQYVGKLDGRPLFGTEFGSHLLDGPADKLRPVSVNDKLSELWTRKRPHRPDDPLNLVRHILDRVELYEREFGRPNVHEHWQHLKLPDGTRLLGGKRDTYPNEDSLDHSYTASEQSGGLYFVAPGEELRRVSSIPRADTLWGDHVPGALFTADQDWLCTSLGLAAIDRTGQVTGRFARSDGLCANQVFAGAELGGQHYFATAWSVAGGGLAVFDVRTSVFTSFHRADGMDSDKLDSVSADAGLLKLTYGVERHAYTGTRQFRRFPNGTFDPVTGIFSSGGKPQLEAAERIRKATGDPMPYLGGFAYERLEHDGKTYLCGTRGLVILNAETPPMQIAPLGATRINKKP